MTVERFEPLSGVPAATRGELRALLDEVERFARRFLATLNDDHFAVLAAWIVHTYVIVHNGAATAYLHVSSAERSSGKTRTLEVIDLLCCRSSGIALNPSSAALFRELDSGQTVTFLLDEVDNYLSGGKIDSEARRDALAILNAGYVRGATVSRVLGAGTKGETVRRYSVFGPKALSGIGELPPTLASRSLRVPLKKRTKSEPVERLRVRRVTPEAAALRERLYALAAVPEVGAYVAAAELELDELEDRLLDAVEVMLALADLAGGDWPERLRAAVVAVAAGTASAVAEASLGLKLLEDLRAVTVELGGEQFSTTALLAALNTLDESPWGGFNDGAGLTPRQLARRLRPYDIHSRQIRLDGTKTLKGYPLEALKDAFDRYVPLEAKQAKQPGSHAGLGGIHDPKHDGSVSDTEKAANPHGQKDVSDVSDNRPYPGATELFEGLE